MLFLPVLKQVMRLSLNFYYQNVYSHNMWLSLTFAF